ncbi:MAG TPA: hypothetical protein VFS33_06940 [Gemmatimonadales bacterium]|nr:hypothetical protein [Gemmatimonadales bacterium]
MRPEATTQMRRWWLIALTIVIALAIYFLAIGAPPKPQNTPTGAQSPDGPATPRP